MAGREKILWAVNYDRLADFLDTAAQVGATGVAIRTDNDVRKAVADGHARGLKVYGWRWPASLHDPAMNEAAKVVDLLGRGLDGYFVDPEPHRKASLNWDRAGLADLAEEFCRTIRQAAPDRPFGTTSHYLAKRVAPRLPWAAFFRYSTVLLPQAYWRSTEGVIGHGDPKDNYTRSIDAWTSAGGNRRQIVPMAGELGVSTAAEITAYASAAATAGVTALHFYTCEASVRDAVWRAVQQA